MLQKLSEQVRACQRVAADARQKAEATADPASKADYLRMEQRWLDRVPWRGVADVLGHRALRHGPDRSAGDCRQADDGIIAQGRDGFQRHVAGALDGPFVVLFEQDGADEADDGGLVGEDADDLGAPLDLAVEALERIGRVQLGAVLLPGRSCRPARRSRPRP